MTREETIKGLTSLVEVRRKYVGMQTMKDEIECLDMAIKALEQQPCEDAVSRNDVIKMLNTMDRYSADKLRLCDTNKEFPSNEVFIVDDVYEELDLLPSVTPQPKTGHNCNEDYADCDQFVCSECGIELQDWHKVVRDDEYDDISYQEYAFRFCPSCGCEIKEVDE